MEYIYSNELQHHGILGQKWGVRRYQNKDGTLTAKGKARQLKVMSKERLQKKDKKDAIDMLRDQAIVGNKYAEKYMKDIAYGDLKPGRDFIVERRRSLGISPFGLVINTRRNIVDIQSDQELNTKPEPDTIKNDLYKSLQSGLEKEKNTVMPSDREWADKMRTDAAFRKTWSDTAKLGLKTLNKINPHLQMDPSDNDNKDWFIFEDQTIGLPDVAYLINKGYKANNVKNMILQARDLDYDTAHSQSNTSFMDSFIFGAREGYGLEIFADEAQKIYDQEHKKK